MTDALAIYTSVYIVDTVLLYTYSAFGMPVSTTASLVFELLGASFVVGGSTIVNWNKSGMVILAILMSIVITGVAAFMVQRALRGAIRHRTADLVTLLLHGGWIGGALLAGLCYFLLLKGMKHFVTVQTIKDEWLSAIDTPVLLLLLWAIFAIIIHLLLVTFRERMARLFFPVLAVIGMIAMSIAFGQNDLANCASPGLASLNLIDAHFKGETVKSATQAEIKPWMLLGCGVLIFLGMTTRNAQRVTRAQVNTGSMGDHVRLWAPQWCIGLAWLILRKRGELPALAPEPAVSERGKTVHYDTLRASVIMSVSASVIATASSLGLPVSTTYVGFAAVLATGMADRIFERGDAALKLGRSIWVVFSWFSAALIAAVSAGLVCLLIQQFSVVGIAIALMLNFVVRRVAKQRSDAQDDRLQREADERKAALGNRAGVEVPDDAD
jgi:phosphate/sulfate permease